MQVPLRDAVRQRAGGDGAAGVPHGRTGAAALHRGAVRPAAATAGGQDAVGAGREHVRPRRRVLRAPVQERGLRAAGRAAAGRLLRPVRGAALVRAGAAAQPVRMPPLPHREPEHRVQPAGRGAGQPDRAGPGPVQDRRGAAGERPDALQHVHPGRRALLLPKRRRERAPQGVQRRHRPVPELPRHPVPDPEPAWRCEVSGHVTGVSSWPGT